MASLAIAQTLPELKQLYRRLASIHHPDKGGCPKKMGIINKQYRIMQRRLQETSANQSRYQMDSNSPVSASTEDFSSIRIGTKLYVNRTPVEVLWVSEDSFRVVASGRSRQAQFCKKTGIGRNTRLKASFSPVN